MLSARYSCQILMKFGFFGAVFRKNTQIFNFRNISTDHLVTGRGSLGIHGAHFGILFSLVLGSHLMTFNFFFFYGSTIQDG